MDESKPKVIVARMASSADVERHKTFLQTTTVGDAELDVRGQPIEPRAGESWEVEKHWDVTSEVQDMPWVNRMIYGTPRIEDPLPYFVAWDSPGHLLYTASEGVLLGWNHAGVLMNGNKYGLRGYSGGRIRRVYSGGSAGIPWLIAEGKSDELGHEGCGVYTHDGDQSGWIEGCDFSNSHRGRLNSPSPAFNPWRPFAGTNAFISRRSSSKLSFALYDNPWGGTPDKSPPRVVEVLDTSELEPEFQSDRSRTYIWHPSGRYLAYVSYQGNPSTRSGVFYVNLVEWDSGQVVLSSPAVVSTEAWDESNPWCYAWSPGGQWLVLDHEATKIWDLQTNQLVSLPDHASHLMWIRRLRGLLRYKYPQSGRWVDGASLSFTSPDGQRRLVDGSVESTESGRTCFQTDARGAAWHPRDPHCFATVGGKGFERTLRIWRLKGS